MPRNYIFNSSHVENADEISFSYTILDPTIFSRLTLSEVGFSERLTWQQDQRSWVRFWFVPKDQCDYYSHCGAFGLCNPNILAGFVCECLPGYEPKVQSEWYLRNGSSRTKEIGGNRDLPMYDLRTIISATDSFALANKLGEGGFGSVYKVIHCLA
ncbi:OLC1v1021811C1 [Oldenlandia corymbosa var. corymbosa]|uniref:OLC1v1021811C1 n=1 Tax=Oldenlandia corymbosa var. corymbosa TaxID=529605 RepID=A0AAV1BWH9_OLDCO|nr:OLC1v1021811C1 [Oldenlandia corymbosa var. corymbosa]